MWVGKAPAWLQNYGDSRTFRLHGTFYKHRLHCLSHVLSLKVLVVIIMQAVHWRPLCKGREAWRVTWNAVPSRA